MSPSSNTPRPTQPRRQERGQRRIVQILQAAATVFAERGYDAATTNAIAAEAGISPGSLYQFFKNKDEIAHSLAKHYAAQLKVLSETTFSVSVGDDPDVEVLVGSLLEQLIAFNRTHPGFKALFSRTDMPAGLRSAVSPVQETVHARVRTLVSDLLPDSAPKESDRIATVAIQIVRGMMPLIADADADHEDTEALTEELRRVLIGYLRPRPILTPRPADA
ncbi:TetR/AcrR family transcriptional regulator [Ruania halotolerans]|uniref:TetR/AcrR family transcriptional regulator n=1 Tax=Ruania halotolerans TaxID=2897773 RepID=UPI001E2BCD95|nr:TetR/AcrR family transcriptional regulator [Ruania halotolerans]UFU05325.1 TetR/AcrR family transcriptional regulator [Ruania halotolerans]